MSSAGDNEDKFRKIFSESNSTIQLLGKQVYEQGNVSISIDESFRINDLEYLIEIDSGNMAKLLVGQYVLLNELYNKCKEKVVFVVIHYYAGYNPKRTIKNLALINHNIYNGEGIKFKVVHIDDIMVNNQISVDSIK